MKDVPRRFYRDVAVRQSPEDWPGGWEVTLDGKLLRSPAKASLILPSEALALAIRNEWDAQQDRIQPRSMPMMQFASTAVDRVMPNRATIVQDIAAYAGSDLICYRAGGPSALVERQQELWQALVDWANGRFDIALRVTTGIMAIEQSAHSLNALARAVDLLDPWRLTAVAGVTTIAGSLIIALALFEGRLTPEAAVAAAQLDEIFQAERWGEDAEAVARRHGQAQEIIDAARFLTLLPPDRAADWAALDGASA
ncbi:MAG: ATP12 family protein [Dongiaceae bacterium]